MFQTARKRMPAILLALVTAAAVIAPAHAAGTLRIGSAGEPESMDPHFSSIVSTSYIIQEMFIGLTTADADGRAVPGAAESWNISTDGLTYTFILRDHTWSDGVPVSAHDFVYAWRRILDPEIAAKYASLLYIIDGAEDYNTGKSGAEVLQVRAVSDKVLEAKLKAPAPYFLEQLTHATSYPVPQHVLTRYDRTSQEWSKPENIVVNGPYKVTEWIPNVHVRLAKNENFFDADSVFFDEVVYFPLEDRTTMLNKFRAGEIDVARDIPSEQIDLIRREIPESLRIAPYQGIYYYAFNTARPPFDDVRVRRALSMTIDREVVAHKVLRTGEIPAYSFVAPGTGNYGAPANAEWAKTPYDERVEIAKGLLADAGYGDGGRPLKVVLRYNTSENHKRVAVAISAMWKALGVETELFNTDVTTHYADLQQGDFEVARAGWISDYNDAQNFLYLLETRTGGFNYGNYSNPEFDRLMVEAENNTNLSQRANVMRQAEAIAMDDQPVAPIYYYISKQLVAPNLKGWRDNTTDKHNSRWLSFDN
ncbi:MAG: peptide ABC transporter substrate-binding protein [Alphaproteobacteria bacterium]|nr:peptide ABC transporter substrate-binding protein [Alphaproteobacteria bacterium]